MSKTLIWQLVGIGAIVVVVAAYSVSSFSRNVAANLTEEGKITQIDPITGAPRVNPLNKITDQNLTILDYIKRGDSYKCLVNQDYGTVTNNGTMYISNGVVRGDFNMKTQGLDINTNFIFKDGYTYTWTSQMPGKAYKMKLPVSGSDLSLYMSNAINTMISNPQATQSGKDVGLNCSPWSPDQSLFSVPSNLTIEELPGYK